MNRFGRTATTAGQPLSRRNYLGSRVREVASGTLAARQGLSFGRCVVGKRHERRRYRYIFCLKFRTGTLLAASRSPRFGGRVYGTAGARVTTRDVNESAAGNVAFGDERCR